MPDHILFLSPGEPAFAPADGDAFAARLFDAGFIGAPLDGAGPGGYRPGDRFLSLLSFLGCSPVVALGEPGATGEQFCRVELRAATAAPQFIAGDNVKLPRCPACRHRSDEWPAIAAAWEADPAVRWRCPVCGQEFRAPELDWRQCAGFGRFFVRVWGIFEGEAVPSEELLGLLATVGGGDWGWFYFSGDAAGLSNPGSVRK